jgi:hypothetical protein
VAPLFFPESNYYIENALASWIYIRLQKALTALLSLFTASLSRFMNDGARDGSRRPGHPRKSLKLISRAGFSPEDNRPGIVAGKRSPLLDVPGEPGATGGRGHAMIPAAVAWAGSELTALREDTVELRTGRRGLIEDRGRAHKKRLALRPALVSGLYR